jgi:hypothetical protein
MKFYPALKKYIESLLPEIDDIPQERQDILRVLAEYIVDVSQASLRQYMNHDKFIIDV